jgi:Tol biopolymer transport system component
MRVTPGQLLAVSALAWAFCADAAQGDTSRASVSSLGLEGNAGSYAPAVSSDGLLVAFQSDADNLVPGDTNGRSDIFIRDRAAGTTALVSLSTAGQQADQDCWEPAVSGDGRSVAFASRASNLVSGDTNGQWDVFVRDLVLGVTERVSVTSAGDQANHFSFDPSLSHDGRFVSFVSLASNLAPGDTNGAKDIFVRDRLVGLTERVSISSEGEEGDRQSTIAQISADGRCVAFVSYALNLTPEETGGFAQIYVRDRHACTTTIASVSTDGAVADDHCLSAAVSADGRFVAFHTAAGNLVGGDVNAVSDVFVRDLQLEATELVSLSDAGEELGEASTSPAISADGRFIGFFSAAPAVPEDTNGVGDAYVRDRLTGETRRASVSSSGDEAGAISFEPYLSADGVVAVFQSSADNLVPDDTNGASDVFVHEIGSRAQLSGTVEFGPMQGAPPTVAGFRLAWQGWVGPFAVLEAAIEPDGQYELTVPEGALEVSLKPTHWLRRTHPVVVSGPTQLDFDLVNGDAEPDNTIDLLDVNAVLVQFGQPDPLADLDASGLTDLLDLNIALVSFGLSGDP